MAFNLLAAAEAPIDWPIVNEQYRNTDRKFEIFPIVDLENGDAIGISIPTNYFNEQSWRSVSKFLIALSASYPLKVYEMYSGHAVDMTTYVPDGLNAE